MSKENNLQDFLTDVANAIREKKGTTEPINVQDFSAEIASIETGGGALPIVEKNDVTFFDYEGTILYSYTKDEFLALTEMPALPSREGLICQGWNWTYEDAIAYVSKYGVLDVGATYITDDGKTRIYIQIDTDERKDISLYLKQSIANGLVVDWGDGNTNETWSTTGDKGLSHTYDVVGNYCITIDVSDGCTLSIGGGSSSLGIVGSTSSDKVRCNMIKKIEIGKGVTTIRSYTFSYLYSLSSITIPQGITLVSGYAFQECYSMNCIVFPKGMKSLIDRVLYNCHGVQYVSIPREITSIGSYSFCYCSSLKSIVIPDSVTTIPTYMLRYCPALSHIVIPESVLQLGSYSIANCSSLTKVVAHKGLSTISANALYSCQGVGCYDFSRLEAIPTLGSSVFAISYSKCKIIVPDNLYDDWIIATNWSSYAEYIIKASEA